MNSILLLLAAIAALIILGAAASVGVLLARGNALTGHCINTSGSHEDAGVTRVAEAAFASPHLLCRKGTADRQILVGTVTDKPLGIVADAAAILGQIGVYLLGSGNSQLMVGSGVITVDANVYTDAAGKVTATPAAGCWLVGRALSPCAADGDEFEVMTIVPILAGQTYAQTVAVSATGATVTALQAWGGITVSNKAASGAAVFALPAALPGMRVNAVVEAAQELRLDPNGAETIALPSSGVQGAAGKYLGADAVGENVMLVCLTAGTWSVLNYTGTWTAES
jgi:hypothetical protein